MLSRVRLKFIRSLHVKKFRDREKLFIVEGMKLFDELLSSGWRIHSVYTTNPGHSVSRAETVTVSEQELGQISMLETPNRVLAIVHMPPEVPADSMHDTPLVLVLDGIRDPGNMGAIMRSADWFGIRDLVLLPGTVEPFNPKVVQASMGSLFRVRCRFTGAGDLVGWMKHTGRPLYGAATDGDDIGTMKLPFRAALALGNESDGLSPLVSAAAKRLVAVPRPDTAGAESLNVAMAASILCYKYFSDNRGGQ